MHLHFFVNGTIGSLHDVFCLLLEATVSTFDGFRITLSCWHTITGTGGGRRIYLLLGQGPLLATCNIWVGAFTEAPERTVVRDGGTEKGCL